MASSVDFIDEIYFACKMRRSAPLSRPARLGLVVRFGVLDLERRLREMVARLVVPALLLGLGVEDLVELGELRARVRRGLGDLGLGGAEAELDEHVDVRLLETPARRGDREL